MTQPIRILGIDPGLRRTGWGVIDVEGNRLIYVACGSVASDDKAALAERLVTIHAGLTRVVDEFRPAEAAVEATFVNKDAAGDAQARPGARHRAAGAGERRGHGGRIRPQSGQEDHRRAPATARKRRSG